MNRQLLCRGAAANLWCTWQNNKLDTYSVLPGTVIERYLVMFFASGKEILSHEPIVFRVMFLLRVMNLCHALPCMETRPVMRENILSWEEWLPAKGNDLDKLEGWATKSS